MDQFDQILTTIASDHLGIPTLEARRSDSLDFHAVSMWAVRDALKAAFVAGAGVAIGKAPYPAAEHETAHTPGPWHYRESDFDPTIWEITSDFCESPLAEVPRWQDEDGNDSEEAKANLLLMTASPALRRAAELVVSRWEIGDLAEAVRMLSDEVNKARAA